MANIKITDLTAYTDPLNTDVLPIVDVTSDTTKKVSIADLLENAGSGTAAAPGIAFDGDGDTGISNPNPDELAFSTGGTGRLFVDSGGNVGVGTAPSAKFDIGGQIRFSNVSSTDNVINTNSDNALLRLFGGSAASVANGASLTLNGISSAVGNYADLASAIGGHIQFRTGTSERLRITSTGQLTHIGGGSTGSPAVGFNGSAPSNSLVVDSTGAVGIGTSSIATVLGGTALEIENSSGSEVIISRSTTGLAGGEFIGGVAFQNNDTSGTPPHYSGIWAKANDAFGYSNLNFAAGRDSYEAGTPHLTIDYLGNVGIGTTSPDNFGFFAVRGSTALGGSYGNVSAHFSDGATTSLFIKHAAGELGYFTDGSVAQTFYTNSTERARIDSSGRLLVGTSTAFESSTDSIVQGLQTSGARIALGRNDTTVSGDNTIGQLAFYGNATSGTYSQIGQIKCAADGTHSGTSRPTILTFSTTADGDSSPTERMRINNAGTVIINDYSAPNNDYFLDIAYAPTSKGCIYLEDFAYYSSQHALVINNQDTNNARTMSDVRFERNGSEVGFIKINPTNVTYSTTSDYRVKENVVSLTNAIERLNQLQVHRFNFISDPDSTVDGFIAHEAQAVVPEAVSGVKDETKDLGDITDASGKVIATAVDEPLPEHIENDHTWTKTHTIDVHQGIDQSKLVPLLTAALQEALAEIESLKARVTALEP